MLRRKYNRGTRRKNQRVEKGGSGGWEGNIIGGQEGRIRGSGVEKRGSGVREGRIRGWRRDDQED